MSITKVRDYFSDNLNYPFIFGDPNTSGDYIKILADGTCEVYKALVKVGEFIYDNNITITVTTEEEFLNACALSGRVGIKCIDTVCDTLTSYTFTSSKYIYTENENDLVFNIATEFVLTGADINIEFKNKITANADVTISGTATTSKVRFNEFKNSDIAHQIYNTSTAVNVTYQKTEYVQSQEDVSLEVWTDNELGKVDSETTICKTPKNIIATSSQYYAYANRTQEESIGGTSGIEYALRRYIVGVTNTEYGNYGFTSGYTGSFDSRHTFRAGDRNSLGTLLTTLTASGGGHIAIGGLAQKWGVAYKSLDNGNRSYYDNGTVSGECDNCYHDGTVWRAKLYSYTARRKEYTNSGYGTYREWATIVSTPSADTDLTSYWVLQYERDRLGNEAFGMALPATLSSDFRHVFNNHTCTMHAVTGSAVYMCNNCYYDGITFRSIYNSDTYASYTNLSGTAYQIRRSTVIVTAANQALTMTTVITPS